MKLPILTFLVVLHLIFGTTSSQAYTITHVPANVHFKYYGRFFVASNGYYKCSYPSSEIRFRFTSDTVNVNLSQYNFSSNDTYFDVLLDGNWVDSINVHGIVWHNVFASENVETHTISIIKRTEPWMGEVNFRGIELKNGQLEELVESAKSHFLFVGASWETGFGNLPSLDFETSKATSFTSNSMNSNLAYPALVSKQLDAEHTCVCYGGKGLNRAYDGNEENQLPTLLFETLAETPTNPFDMQSDVPNLIVLNLGGNDFGVGIPDKETYTSKYIQTVDTLLKMYPNSKIIISELILEPFDTLVNKQSVNKEIEYNTFVWEHFKNQNIDKVYFWQYEEFGIKFWGQDSHPNRITYQKVADSLVSFINKNVVLDDPTGIIEEEVNEIDFRLFPNPSSSIVYLDGKVEKWQLYNEFGQKIMESDEDRMDISNLSKGIYLFSHNGRFTRLVKN